jgi:hypothetical protein
LAHKARRDYKEYKVILGRKAYKDCREIPA